MCSNALKGVSGVLRVGLCVVVVWTAPVSVWAQSVLSTQRSTGAASELFSKFDDSLTRAADVLLVSPAPSMVPVAAKAVAGESTSAAVDVRVQPRPQVMLDSGLTLAAARLDLLRPAIEPILRNRGVPIEMAAVVAVESGGRSSALSPKGARGLWQLMPDTARRYGLRVDEVQDDRVDLFKATDAAARYLHDLYAQFGDWKLALAAYNTGEANLGSAMLRAHTQDFDQLVNMRILPLETRNYVPRVLAAAQFLGQTSTLGEAHSIASATTVFAVSDR